MRTVPCSVESGGRADPGALMDALEARILLGSDPFPNRVYYPEGFAGATITEFVPIANPGEVDAQYQVVARFETGERDMVIAEGTLGAHSRGGITASRAGDEAASLVPWGRPYALEVRSTAPLAASLSHYDFGAGVGESFVGDASLGTEWTIPGAEQAGGGGHDFLVWYNPGDTDTAMTIDLIPADGSAPSVINTTTGALRRGGLDLSLIAEEGKSIHVVSDHPIVVAMTSYGTVHPVNGPSGPSGVTLLGQRGAGSTFGIVPLGRAFLAPETGDWVDVYNPDPEGSATISLALTFSGGSPAPTTYPIPYTTPWVVGPGSTARFEMRSSLWFGPGDESLPSGVPFSIAYSATLPVFLRTTDLWSAPGAPPPTPLGVRLELVSSAPTGAASTSVVFADGFMDNTRAGVDVFQTLSIVNPHSAATSLGASDVQVSIRFNYTDGFVLDESFVLEPGGARILDLHAFEPVIAQARDHARYFFSIDVQSDIGAVAQFWQSDFAFAGQHPGGAFSSAGMLMGTIIPFADAQG